MDSRAECGQLHPADVTRDKKVLKKKLTQTNDSAHLVQYGLRSVKADQKLPWFSPVADPGIEFGTGTPRAHEPITGAWGGAYSGV